MKLPAETFERARLAVLDEMGWEDDRANTDEYAGKLWEIAGDIVRRVIDAAFPNERARGPMPRGTCPTCGKEYALAQGVMRLHDGEGFTRCRGTGSLPKDGGAS